MNLRFRHDVSLEILPSGNGYLFDPVTGYIYTLNATAVVVVSALLEKPFLDFAAQRVSDMFEIPDVNHIHEDIVSFVSRMQQYGIIEEQP